MSLTSLPSFSQLRAFVALCDHQHFGEAARALNVSQPSLSQAITALERRVGGELVERTTRSVLVTPLGQTLLPYARDAVLAAEQFTEAVTTQGAAFTGTLRLGLIPTLAPYLAPLLLEGLRREIPSLAPELREMVTGDLLNLLNQGRIDAAILALDVDMDLHRATCIPMFEEPLVILVPPQHPWSGRTDVSPAELDGENLLMLDEGNCLREETMALCQQYGTVPPVAVATTLLTVIQMVTHGMGVTVVPEGSLRMMGDQPHGIARFADASATRKMGLVYRSSSSRGSDFETLAKLLTKLTVSSGLPVTPLATS